MEHGRAQAAALVGGDRAATEAAGADEEDAMRPRHRLVARIRLTGSGGEPGLTWSAGPADTEPV